MSEKSDKLSIAEQYQLDTMDQRIMQLKIQYPTITDGKIGELVSLSRTNVNRRRRKPAFKAAIAEYFKPAQQRIEQSIDKAARIYVASLDSKNEMIKRQTAKELAVHAGILKVKEENAAREVEPLVIEMPMAQKTIEVKTVRDVKELPSGKPHKTDD